MRRRFIFVASIILLAGVGSSSAQLPRPITITVRETTGIRRFNYPVNTLVHVRLGLRDASHARLLLGDTEVAAQFKTEAQWSDGSVQLLGVDFNASLGPLETATYRLEYGDAVTPTVFPRGLSVTEGPDGIQVGNVRFGRTAAPLIASVKYRDEAIGQGINGITILDRAGVTHGAEALEAMKVEVRKRGPLYVVLRYSGQMRLAADYAVPIRISAEMPNSKSWVKIGILVDDRDGRVRELALHTPLALGAYPWLWDHGTGSWTYGAIRSGADSVLFSQRIGTQQRWEIRTGPKGQEQLYEVSSEPRPNVAEGWGHIQGAREVDAFGIEAFGSVVGTTTVTMDGSGQLSFRMTPAGTPQRHSLTVYQHFVSTPVQIGAATNPVAMLSPLAVTVE